jgi:hypothetical protein
VPVPAGVNGRPPEQQSEITVGPGTETSSTALPGDVGGPPLGPPGTPPTGPQVGPPR